MRKYPHMNALGSTFVSVCLMKRLFFLHVIFHISDSFEMHFRHIWTFFYKMNLFFRFKCFAFFLLFFSFFPSLRKYFRIFLSQFDYFHPNKNSHSGNKISSSNKKHGTCLEMQQTFSCEGKNKRNRGNISLLPTGDTCLKGLVNIIAVELCTCGQMSQTFSKMFSVEQIETVQM